MDRRCGAQTAHGTPCRAKVNGENDHCWVHKGPACSVCLAPMTPQTNRTLGCGHAFHVRCVERWKRSCRGDPTCPMCRIPFDLPTYKCRLIIERTIDNQRITTNFDSSNVLNIVEGFGLDFRQLVPPATTTGRFVTDIHFDVEPGEVLIDILRELGLPEVGFNSD